MSPGAVLKHWLRLKVSMFVQYELLQNTGWRPTFEKGLKRAPGVLLHISKQLPRQLAKARWTVPNMEVTTRQPIYNMSYRFSCGRCLLRWRWHSTYCMTLSSCWRTRSYLRPWEARQVASICCVIMWNAQKRRSQTSRGGKLNAFKQLTRGISSSRSHSPTCPPSPAGRAASIDD